MNSRLFKSNRLRSSFHLLRFKWLNNAIKIINIKYENIMELGCFDGKVLNFLVKKPVIPNRKNIDLKLLFLK